MKLTQQRKKLLQQAFIDTLPVLAGYLVLGIGFGVLLQSKGYGFGWAVLMSLTVYAGSMQYVAVDLLASGASLISTALMTLMVNGRHLFYGLSMLDKYQKTGRWKPYLIFSLTDETYSLVCSHHGLSEQDRKLYMIAISVLNHFYWVTGSALGGILGAAVRFNTRGVDFAMTALFVVIFTEQWLTSDQHLPAVVGVAVSVVCLILFGPSGFVIPSMVGITAVLLLLRGRLEERSNSDE
ncbi:MAG: AzlC family ABC transporter permease [Angelakisella sp.]|nr:AzlC family ABC transporter permease [Angelakisella sp.]